MKPNHKCIHCGREYYACDYCDRTSYRRFACSLECYLASAWRINSSVRPQRTDLTEEQIDELMNASVNVLKMKSLEELRDYAREIDEIGFDGVMEIINRKKERL